MLPGAVDRSIALLVSLKDALHQLEDFKGEIISCGSNFRDELRKEAQKLFWP